MPDYQDEFVKNPVNFLRAYSLSPPDGSAGDVIKEWNIETAGNILEGVGNESTATVKLHKAGIARKWATFVQHPLFPNCMTVSLKDARSNEDEVPLWWLPWQSLAVTTTKIPKVPGNLYNPTEDEFPRFFMTAGINGCSVFVQGPPDAPSIYHAGITGKLARPADEFWREQLNEALKGSFMRFQHRHEVHSSDYMGADRQIVRDFQYWKEHASPRGFRLEVTSCFGSVIGVRYGRYWSFYLQENAYTQDLSLMKSSQVERHTYDVPLRGEKYYYTVRGSREMVSRGQDQSVPVKFLGMTLGHKAVKVFVRRSHQTCTPVRVGEIYPTKTFSADFRARITPRG